MARKKFKPEAPPGSLPGDPDLPVPTSDVFGFTQLPPGIPWNQPPFNRPPIFETTPDQLTDEEVEMEKNKPYPKTVAEAIGESDDEWEDPLHSGDLNKMKAELKRMQNLPEDALSDMDKIYMEVLEEKIEEMEGRAPKTMEEKLKREYERKRYKIKRKRGEYMQCVIPVETHYKLKLKQKQLPVFISMARMIQLLVDNFLDYIDFVKCEYKLEITDPALKKAIETAKKSANSPNESA